MLRNLKHALEEKHITYIQVSKVLDCRPATVSDKINGKTKFSFDEAFKIQEVFLPEYDLKYLFDPDGKEPQPA